jgi:transposase
MISDEAWKELEWALKQAKHSPAGAPAAMSDRAFIEAVLYMARTGCPWRDLPKSMGYWHAVYMRFRRWEARQVWKRLWELLQQERFAQARVLFIDSTTVRAHPHAAGAPKKTVHASLWAALGADSPQRSTPPA